MLYALVDSMETTLSNENKSSPTSQDSGDRKSNQPNHTDADDECDSQDKESSAQHGKNSCPKPAHFFFKLSKSWNNLNSFHLHIGKNK